MVLKVQDEYMCWLYKYTQILLKGELDEHDMMMKMGTHKIIICAFSSSCHIKRTPPTTSHSHLYYKLWHIHTVLAIVRKRQSFFKALLSARFSLLC